MVAIPDKDGKLLVGYFDYLNSKELYMSENDPTPPPSETVTETTETVTETVLDQPTATDPAEEHRVLVTPVEPVVETETTETTETTTVTPPAPEQQ